MSNRFCRGPGLVMPPSSPMYDCDQILSPQPTSFATPPRPHRRGFLRFRSSTERQHRCPLAAQVDGEIAVFRRQHHSRDERAQLALQNPCLSSSTGGSEATAFTKRELGSNRGVGKPVGHCVTSSHGVVLRRQMHASDVGQKHVFPREENLLLVAPPRTRFSERDFVIDDRSG